MPKIRFKLFRSILTAIICLGVISVYTYAYLYKKGGVTTPVGKNSETIFKTVSFWSSFKKLLNNHYIDKI